MEKSNYKKQYLQPLSQYFAIIGATLILSILQIPTYAQENASKRISKSYNVDGNELLKIQNKYGKVHINTNNGTTILVDIEIKATAKSQEKAQKLLDRVEIISSQAGGIISYETSLDTKKESGWWDNWGSNQNGKNDFEINYTVAMPAKNPLEVKNNFGNIYLANFTGKLDLKVGYGNLKAESISGSAAKNIQIGYGNGTIVYLQTGKLVIKYSNLDLQKAGDVFLENAYSNTEIGEVDKLELDHKYGDLNVEKASEISGTSAYANFNVDFLKTSLRMSSKYNGSFRVNAIGENFKNIEIDAKYNSCNLKFAENAGCNFEISTKYGSFKLNKDLATFTNRDVNDYGGKYEGKYKKGGNKVMVTSQYGDISFK
jgi:Putative adhesin